MHPKTAADPEVSYPALPLQQGMIFNGLRLPDAGIDVVQCVIQRPNLDVTRSCAPASSSGATQPVQVVRPAVALDFSVRTDSLADFLTADRLRGFTFDEPPLVQVTGVPRFVFVKSPVEFKPFYVDLESLPSVEQFAHAIRALDQS